MQKLSEALGEAKIRVEGCSSFLKAAIKWSVEFGAQRNGSLELHDMLAEYIYSESPEVDMTRVSYHFVRGKHPKTFASTLVNFMGKVLRQLRCSDGYQDSVKELDAALSEITSNPFFPQGLAHLSSDTLHRARDFVLEHLIHTLPLRDTHLRDFTIATIEMDLDELRRTRNDFLNVYLNKLVLQNSSVNPDLDRRGFMEDSIVSSQDIVPNTKIEGDFTEYTIQELIRRQSAVSCISSAEAGLNILCKAIRQGNWNKSDHGLF